MLPVEEGLKMKAVERAAPWSVFQPKTPAKKDPDEAWLIRVTPSVPSSQGISPFSPTSQGLVRPGAEPQCPDPWSSPLATDTICLFLLTKYALTVPTPALL